MPPPAATSDPRQERQEASTSPKRGRRTVIACLRCRERKVRCSGSNPCVNCTRHNVECCFEQEDRRITVSERYLNQLKRKASALDSQESPSRPAIRPHPTEGSPGVEIATHDRTDPSVTSLDGETICPTGSTTSEKLPRLRNPLVTTPVSHIKDSDGRRRFLGPSSTWAYSRHVMSMIRSHITIPDSPDVPLKDDGAARPFNRPGMQIAERSLISPDRLPSLDYALYLVNTVKFHISQTYHIFDEPSFMRHLYSLYNDGPRPINQQNRLAYIQFLIVIALGKALLNRNSSGTRSQVAPSGSEYFVQALDLIPDVVGLYADPIMAVEICCGLALYMQSVDDRNSAYVYLGLGLRIALSQGLHRDANTQTEEPDSLRYRSAWWTLYILDRKLSSLMGAPSSIHDCDISVPLSKAQQGVRATSLQMHVKLSRLMTEVLNTVYGIDGRLDSTFLQNIQTTLQKLAALAVELNASPELKVDNTGPIGRVPATLNLCYHQCIVLATRPLLVCLLREKLEQKARGSDSSTSREMANPIRALLRTSYDSATKSLRILEMLRDQDLLEMFLPFDLDHTFSSGFVLTLFSALQPFPEACVDDSHFYITLSLLNALVNNGNTAADFRRGELQRLKEMLDYIGLDAHNSEGAQEKSKDGETLVEDVGHVLSDQAPVADEEFLQVLGQGVSPDQVLAVANLLSEYPPMSDMVPGLVDTSWLWEDLGGTMGAGN